MMFALSLLIPIIIATAVGILTNSWIWGLVSGFVSFPLSIMFFSLIAGILFGYPNKYSRKWASIMGATKHTYEPTKREIIEEIILKERTTLMRKQIRNTTTTDIPTVGTSPFKPTNVEVLTAAFLGAPSTDTERLESILKELLQEEYNEHYKAAKRRIISRH